VSWTGRAAADLLRHRGPALLVETIDAFDGGAIVCASRGAGPWPWPLLLEGAAQAAGLLSGLAGGLSNRAVIAEYRGVRVHVERHEGPVRFGARLDRRVLQFRRCAIEARDAKHGTLLLEGRVTLAPASDRQDRKP
jgi:hypothetical protein